MQTQNEKINIHESLNYLKRIYHYPHGYVCLCHKNAANIFHDEWIFLKKDLNPLIHQIERINHLGATSIWISVNIFCSDSRKNKNVKCGYTFFCEFDYGMLGHKKENVFPDVKTYNELIPIITQEYAKYDLSPNMIISSGYGIHCYWIVDSNIVEHLNPSEFSNTNETLYQLGLPDDLKRLDKCDTKPYSQIMRIPGTYNKKTKDPKLCHIIRDDGNTYKLANFLDILKSVQINSKNHLPEKTQELLTVDSFTNSDTLTNQPSEENYNNRTNTPSNSDADQKNKFLKPIDLFKLIYPNNYRHGKNTHLCGVCNKPKLHISDKTERIFKCYNPECAMNDGAFPFLIYFMFVENIHKNTYQDDLIEFAKKQLFLKYGDVLRKVISDDLLKQELEWDNIPFNKCIETQILLKFYLVLHNLSVKNLCNVLELDYRPVKLALNYRIKDKQIGKKKFMKISTKLYFACTNLINPLKKIIGQNSLDKLVDLKKS